MERKKRFMLVNQLRKRQHWIKIQINILCVLFYNEWNVNKKQVWCNITDLHISPGAGGVWRYTSSLYSPNPALLHPLTLSTYTLSICSRSITALTPLTSSRRSHAVEELGDLAPPHAAPAPPARRWYSTEKCQAGAESWGRRQHKNSWS